MHWQILSTMNDFRSVSSRRYVVLLCWGGCVLLYYVWFQAFYNLVAHNSIFPWDSVGDFVRGMFINIPMDALFFAYNWLIVFKAPIFRDSIGKRIVTDTLLSFTVLIGVNIMYIWIYNALNDDKALVEWAATAMNNATVLLIIEVIYYVSTYRAAVRKVEQKEREAIQYKYDVLKSQVNPHFLFNSLNILYSLIDIDIEKSKKFTLALSRTYRSVISRQELKIVPLAEEIKLLEAYAEVLKIRYNDSLTVDIRGLDNVKGHTVISYSLQLLLENVIKHNVITQDKPMAVLIDIGHSHVTVGNPIRRRPVTDHSSGMGLRYIARLAEAEGVKFEYGVSDSRFTARLPFID